MPDNEVLALPALRDDLQIKSGPTAADDTPSWTIYDPLRGRYFRIGWCAFQMLTYWSAANTNALLEKVQQQTTCSINENDVRDFVRFLFANNLTQQAINADYQTYLQQSRASRPPWHQQWLHHYLFFRIPLLRPDRFLRRTLPYLQWCFDKRVLYVLIGIGVLGGYLVSRQWDHFFATFLHFFDWQGLTFYGLALLFTKLCHELGHAYTAVHYGCRVPVMGIAFMAMFPMPYTDVTDAWRLPLRRQRVAIDAAGVLVELALAVLATLAWSFLPDGVWRSAAFILATVTWVMTLTVNLSPFMRFDGYYMLSDAWGVDNLQSRAFALARWQIRCWVLGWQTTKPENLPPALQYKMVIYAFATWIYRLIVFTGLALMVYHFFFKLLGLVLFAVEIVWFILRPLYNELRIWQTQGLQQLSTMRKFLLVSGFTLILLMAFVPWSQRVRLPAVLEAKQHTVLYAPEDCQIDTVLIEAGQSVAAGQILLLLQSPKLADAIHLSEKRLDYYRLRLERATTTREASADMRVAMQQWSAEAARLSGLKQQYDQLKVRAPFAGLVTDLTEDLHPKRWIDAALPLLTLVSPEQGLLHAIANHDDISSLAVGQSGRFIPEDIMLDSLDVKVSSIDSLNLREFDQPYLASVYGGAVPVRKNAAGDLIPTNAAFAVKLSPSNDTIITTVQRGNVIVNAQPKSFGQRLFESTVSLLIRESGF